MAYKELYLYGKLKKLYHNRCLLIIRMICQQTIHQLHLQATLWEVIIVNKYINNPFKQLTTTFSDVLYQGLCSKLLTGNKAN